MTSRLPVQQLAARAAERRQRLKRGRFSEAVAAALLIAKGYRILGRRVKTRAGEIDIIAVRGKRLVFVEVKRRLTRDDSEGAVSVRQAARIRRAADLWLAQRPRYHGHVFAYDVILSVPGRLPRHIPDGM
jgi:putative endonuclease